MSVKKHTSLFHHFHSMCACIACSNIYLMGGVSDVCLMGGVSDVCLMGGVSDVCLMGGFSDVCLMGGCVSDGRG